MRDVQRTTPTAANPTEEDCVSNGGILATWRKMTTFVKWTRDWDADWDIAWITLSDPVGYTSGWKGIRTAEYAPGTILNVAGYGGDCPSGGDCSDNMKTMACKIESDCTNSQRYYYTCDTIGGACAKPMTRARVCEKGLPDVTLLRHEWLWRLPLLPLAARP